MTTRLSILHRCHPAAGLRALVPAGHDLALIAACGRMLAPG
jgi:hypothetical protein